MQSEKGGRGLRSIEEEYKVTKITAAVKLYGNGIPAMAMIRKFEERAELLVHSSLVKEAARYAEEKDLQLQLEYPNPACIKHDSGEVITGEKLKEELRRCLQHKTLEAVHEQNGQRELISARSNDESLNFEGCFSWRSGWTQCPTHTVAGMFELYEQLFTYEAVCLPETHTDKTGEVMRRLCNKAPESVVHVLAGCTSLAQIKYVTRHNAALTSRYFSPRFCKS